jgi:alpha,alpha-trehalase
MSDLNFANCQTPAAAASNDPVTAYILENWKNTVRLPGDTVHGMVRLPKPFTVPCAKVMFTDFYYWDTYFTNLGLMRSGLDGQAENNLDNIKFFIDNLGYMPNANHLLDRSQPPLFTRGVYDLYKFRGDEGVIRKYIDAVLRELSFFRADRTVFEGLAAYGNNCTRQSLDGCAPWLADRVGEKYETADEGAELADQLLSIAESGWDFTPRFPDGEKRFAVDEYVHIDLNCLLYDAEVKAAQMLEAVGRGAEASELRSLADKRRDAVNKYMRDPDTGVYYDYNYKKGFLSPVLSCASFYPFAAGIAEDARGAAETLRRLELPYGVSTCEYRGENARYLQWDYPAMWPSNVYFACTGLDRAGLSEDADRVADKYVSTLRAVFEKTGSLWEKYDASACAVSVTSEYETPEMLGWTAGVYLWLASGR